MTTDRTYCDVPGFYAVREAKGAVEVGCFVEHGPSVDPETGEPMDRSWYWSVWINGELRHCGPGVYPRLLVGRRIDEAEYRYLIDDRKWAAEHAPHLPEAQPRERVNISALPLPF